MSNIDTDPLMDAVPRIRAQAILNIGHSKLYEALGLGLLSAVKDGSRTLITVESIRRYQANRPRASFTPPKSRDNRFAELRAKPKARKRAKRARRAA